jgi:hypothetical protein
MYVTRGDLSPEQIIAKRNREPEAARAVPSDRKVDQNQSVPQPPETAFPSDRQKVRQVQRALSRAQSVLAGLEEFRSILFRTGVEGGERAALEVMDRGKYQGEAVLEPYRQLLLRSAASRDSKDLDRLIGSVRQNIAALSNDRAKGVDIAAPGALAALMEGIRRNGQDLQRLERDNVLRLLS